MNDENDKPKDNDWGMTMPHLRYQEKKDAGHFADDFSDEFAADRRRPSDQAADDGWGMTTPNLNVSNLNVPNDYSSASDFDKTAPNINLPRDVWENKTPPPFNPLPDDDWGMSAPNVSAPAENRRDEWEMDAPNFSAPSFNAPPAPPKKNDWAMPVPVFRVSDGENIDDVKKTAAFKLSDLQDFDMDTKSFKEAAPSDSPSPDLFDKPAPSFDFQAQPPPVVPNNFAEAPPAFVPESSPVVAPVAAPITAPSETIQTPEKKKRSKLPFVVGGLLAMFLFAGVFLVGVYFLLLSKSVETAAESEPGKSDEPIIETTAPPAPLTAAPLPSQTIDLPQRIEYKGAMMLVAAGEYTMGSDAGADEAKPAHKVVLPAFYIDRTEVTNAEYKAFCDATGKSYPTNPHIEKDYFNARPNAPVVGVSFADAKAYAEWAGKRLPTEEEWEKAASWDDLSKTKREFPWGDDFKKSDAAYQTPKISDVGKYAGGASPAGALDMAGNVLEWVDAYFQPYPNGASSNPEFGETNRVVRGGHFASKSPDSLKTTKRIYIPPTVASGEDDEKLVAAIIGFRCAVSADDRRVAEALQTNGK